MNHNFRDLWRPKMHASRIFSPARADYPAQIIRRSWVAMSVVDSANRVLRAKAFRNVPSGESDESSSELVQVQDPRHPLYGSSFRAIRRVAHRGGNFPPSYEVEYLNGRSLLIPVTATEPYHHGTNQTKLSIEALRELVFAVEGLECHEHGSERSVGDIAACSTASGRRRHRRSSGGDLP